MIMEVGWEVVPNVPPPSVVNSNPLEMQIKTDYPTDASYDSYVLFDGVCRTSYNDHISTT